MNIISIAKKVTDYFLRLFEKAWKQQATKELRVLATKSRIVSHLFDGYCTSQTQPIYLRHGTGRCPIRPIPIRNGRRIHSAGTTGTSALFRFGRWNPFLLLFARVFFFLQQFTFVFTTPAADSWARDLGPQRQLIGRQITSFGHEFLSQTNCYQSDDKCHKRCDIL